MKKFKIKGTANYYNLATGFWGITDSKGNQWRPINMPDQLKEEGATVLCTAREVEEEMSIFMWGKAVRIVGFETVMV